MFLLAGLEKCAIEGKDRESKAANYALVQELAEEFKEAERRPAVCRFAGIVRKRAGDIHTGSKDGTVLRQASPVQNGGEAARFGANTSKNKK